MVFRGDLQSVPLGDVLQTLLQNGKEGTLKIQSDNGTTSIYCCPRGITLPEPRILEKRRLGDILVLAQITTRTQVEKVAIQLEEGQLLGQALVNAGVIDQELLDRVLKVQIEDEIFNLFELNKGEFEFFEDEIAIPSPNDRGLPLFRVEGLLLEAARRMDEWGYIRERIGDLDSIVMVEPGLEEETDLATRLVKDLINGKRTLRMISDSILASPFEVAKVVADLVERKKARLLEEHELLTLAQELIDSGETDEAGSILKRLKPNLQNLLLQGNDVSILADLFSKVGDVLTATNILLEKVRQASGANLDEKGLPFLRQAHRIAPDDPRILRELAKVSGNIGDKEGRIQYLISTVNIHLNDDRFDEAIATCGEILETDPNNVFVLEKMPELMVRAGDRKGAIAFLEERAANIGKKGDPKVLVGIFRGIMKIDPTRKDISEKLQKAQRAASNKNRRLIHLAGLLIIVLGGVLSWVLNRSDGMTDMDRVAYTAIRFAGGDIQGARTELLNMMDALSDPDAVDQAQILLANIENRLKESDRFTAEVEKQKYLDRLKAVQDLLGQDQADQALLALKELAGRFDSPDYAKTTREECQRTVQTINSRVSALRTEMAAFVQPGLDEELAEALAHWTPIVPEGEPDRLRVLAEVLSGLVDDEEFTEMIGQELIDEVTTAAGEAEEILKTLESMAERVDRLNSLADLSLLYDEAKEAEADGRLDKALTLYGELVSGYGEGQLKDLFQEKKERLETFFDGIADVERLAGSGEVEAAHALAVDLLDRYKEPSFSEFLRIPVLITTVPEGAQIRSEGKVLGVAPKIVYLQPEQNLNLALEQEGYDRKFAVLDQRGGALQHLTLNRKKRFSARLGGVVEGRPLLDDKGLLLPSRNGTLFRVDPGSGDIVQKFKTGSLSGIPASVVLGHGLLYCCTLEGEIWALSPDALTLSAKKGLPAGTRCSPVVFKTGVLAACLDGSLLAFSPDLQTLKWRFDGKGKILADPVLEGGLLAAAFTSGDLLGLDVGMGETTWHRDTGTDEIAGLASSAGLLVICCRDGWVQGLDMASGRERWRTDVDCFIGYPPVIAAEGVFVSAGKDVLLLDGDSGAILERYACGEILTTPPAVSRGYLAFGTAEGNLHYRPIAKGTDEWVYHATEAISSVPIMTDDTVYVIDSTGQLSAIIR